MFLQVLEKIVEKSSDIRKGFVAMLNIEKLILSISKPEKKLQKTGSSGSAPICAL
jgi:hypothetical protein